MAALQAALPLAEVQDGPVGVGQELVAMPKSGYSVTNLTRLTNMRSMQLLQTKGLSEAKAQLSDVMTEVVHRHHPVVVDRHRGKEAMLLFAPEDLRPLLMHFRFAPETAFADGEWTLFSPELNLTAGGETFDAALDELVEVAEEYAQDYFARQEFYAQTDRVRHMPWLLRLALTEPSARRELFVEPPERVPRPA